MVITMHSAYYIVKYGKDAKLNFVIYIYQFWVPCIIESLYYTAL